MKQVFLLCLAVALATTESRKVAFQKCGGDVKDVEIQPCPSEPCTFKRGDTAEINVAFKANQDSPKLATRISTVIARDLELYLPSGKRDGCKGQGIECPLKSGSDYVFNYKLDVKQAYPKVNATAKVSVTGDEGSVFCITFPAIVTD